MGHIIHWGSILAILCLFSGCQAPVSIKPVSQIPEVPANRYRPLKSQQPVYPSAALAVCQTGWVHVAFKIDKQGKVLNPMVVNASPKGIFEQSVLESLQAWQFKSVRFPRTKAHHEVIEFSPDGDCK